MSQLLETLMLISFGLSWPVSIYKSYNVRTTQGKSILFLFLIDFGYICGIASKIASGHITYVLFFYVLNCIMVLVDIFLYFRNYKLDKKRK